MPIGPKDFGRVQIVLVGSKLFWSGPSRFGPAQIILVRFKLDFSRLFVLIYMSKIILTQPERNWTRPKRLVHDQNDLDSPKSFWTHRRTRHYRELKEWKMTYLNKFYKFQRNCRKWNSWGEEWDRTSFVLFVRQQINRKRIGNSFNRNSVVSALPDLHLECGYLRNRFILRKKIEWLLSLHKSC